MALVWWVICGISRIFRALVQGQQDGDFEQAMEHAQQQYRNDAAPDNRNQAPVEFWPYANRFPSILYAAGKRLGADARRCLGRIDDPDLRLFAHFELAAALAGLPEFRGVQREYWPQSFRAGHRMPRPVLGPPILSHSGPDYSLPEM